MRTPYYYVPFVSDIYRFVRRQIRSIVYSGQVVYCTVCGGNFGRFIGKEDGVCPYCGSETRHRFLVAMITNILIDRQDGYRTLFFAPDWGVQRWLKKRPQKFSVVTADLSAPNVDLQLDIVDTKMETCSYDAVLCSHVLEHVPNDLGAMKEIRRLLRPNGHLLLQVPIDWGSATTDEDFGIVDPDERQARFGQFDHVRLYGRDIMAKLDAAEFSVEAVHCKDFFDDGQMKKYGLWNDVIFVCKADPT